MKTVLIAGAGQLGSRHLQGVKLSKNELDIWVYDISKQSLDIAKQRYDQIDSSIEKKIHFVQSLKEIPKFIDVAIIASGSKPRYSIVLELLSEHNVLFMVLEKFLFPRLSDYDEIEKLISINKIKAYVNCPRRMFQSYKLIKTVINNSYPLEMSYIGKDWGLCCNSIHFIDIFMYLTGLLDYELDISNVFPEVIDSKRSGYVELRGSERITTKNGSTLLLSSTSDFDGKTEVILKNGGKTIRYDETLGKLSIDEKMRTTEVKYQSSLSGVVIDDLLMTGNCDLTTYTESAKYHKKFLCVIAPFINKLNGWTSDSCPIT